MSASNEEEWAAFQLNNLLTHPYAAEILSASPQGPRPIDQQALLIAWFQLTDEERLILIGLYGLNGQTPSTLVSLARALGRSDSYGTQIRLDVLVRLRELLWQIHDLHGLSMATMHFLMRNGFAYVQQFYDEIGRLVELPYFGPAMFSELNRWLRVRNYPSLTPYVPKQYRQKVGLSRKR